MWDLKFRRTVTPHCRVVRGHAPEKICKITLKARVFVHSGNKFWYNAFTRLTRRMKSQNENASETLRNQKARSFAKEEKKQNKNRFIFAFTQ